MVSNSTSLTFLINCLNYLADAIQIIAFTQNIILVFWLSHVIYSLYVYVKRWLQLKRSREGELQYCDATNNRIYFYKESIIRYIIFFFFLLFELGYFLEYSLDEIIQDIFQTPSFDIILSDNCTLLAGTIANSFFDMRPIIFFENFLASHGRSLIFSITWMYAVLMLHLAHAAKNELLQPKQLTKWILFGVSQQFTFFFLCWIPWTTIFALILEPLISQFNFIVAVVLARRFLRAMKSRVNSAYHTWNISSRKQQTALLRQYKRIIPISLGIMEIFYLKDIILFMPYSVVETVLLNPCLYHIPKISFNENEVQYILLEYQLISFILIHLINALCFLGLTGLNMAMICKYFISKCKRVRYRYHVADAITSPLLENH